MKKILTSKLYLEDLEKVIGNLDLSPLNGARILVTGGLGLICSAVADLFWMYNEKHKADIRVFIADINREGFAARYGGLPCVTYVAYDATKPLEMDVHPDFILHGAGLASPELYVSRPVETMLSNFNGVLNLLEYARTHKTKRMLYISSSEVYGIKSTPDAFEESRFGSVDINQTRASYPEAKRASEVLCRSYSSEYGVDTVMVRPGHIYGPTASARDQRVSSVFAYLAAAGKPLEMKSAGLQRRSYCYCLDCAAAMLVALLRGQTGESYNIGHDEVTSIRRMAEILAAAGQVELKIKEPDEADLRHFNPMDNSSLENRKIKSLGYRDTFTIKEGLTHTVRILSDIMN